MWGLKVVINHINSCFLVLNWSNYIEWWILLILVSFHSPIGVFFCTTWQCTGVFLNVLVGFSHFSTINLHTYTIWSVTWHTYTVKLKLLAQMNCIEYIFQYLAHILQWHLPFFWGGGTSLCGTLSKPDIFSACSLTSLGYDLYLTLSDGYSSVRRRSPSFVCPWVHWKHVQTSSIWPFWTVIPPRPHFENWTKS